MKALVLSGEILPRYTLMRNQLGCIHSSLNSILKRRLRYNVLSLQRNFDTPFILGSNRGASGTNKWRSQREIRTNKEEAVGSSRKRNSIKVSWTRLFIGSYTEVLHLKEKARLQQEVLSSHRWSGRLVFPRTGGRGREEYNSSIVLRLLLWEAGCGMGQGQ